MKDFKESTTYLFLQDVNSNDNNFSFKIIRYFYSLFMVKKETKLFVKYFQIIIETIQLVSYIFSPIHYNSWKLQEKNIKKITTIVGGFRLSILMQFLDYTVFSYIQYILIVFIFLFFLIVILQILFIDSASKKYKFSIILISSIINTITIIFYLPITEILLMPIKCINGKVEGVKNGKLCWKNIHYLNSVLGILGAILLFIWCTFMIHFYFYPFQIMKSTIRVNSNNDILNIIVKLALILQDLLIKNEYFSLVILILSSVLLFFNCYYESTYNIKRLNNALNMKNIILMWSYFVLFLTKIFKNFKVNGFIYLLLYGYPLNIYLSIIISKEQNCEEISFFDNINNPNDFIKKTKNNMKLINSFIENNKNKRNGNENEEQKNIILLNGNIEFHIKVCTNSDCPLKKFINNEGNFNIQRQCLINYMNLFFNKGFRKFPKNIYLTILYIIFNYSKRFNLNSVKANLLKLKKIECSLKEQFIIYCLEQNINDINNNNGYSHYRNKGEDNDSQINFSEQKYKKLKYLIENSIKLYAEFWGIFTTNITSIINTTKLYSLGEKLNIYLNEINNLWDNELKNQKMSSECQNIAQLYSKFLLEILWDRKKSREISKKLNDENINNYHLNDNKKGKEERKNNIGNIELLLDNEDYILFCESDEKGNSTVFQCSMSFSLLLGYQKYDMIGKSLDIIFPSVLIEENRKYLEECIKLSHNKESEQRELYQVNDSNKNTKLIIVKNKMGYIFPLFASYIILDDNDYSDSILVRIKIERKELKSEYPYYILANHDLVIENISSSALNLGLTLDLLKKYIVKMDILLRTENNNVLNIYENYYKYEEESKEVTWIFPNIIYPKDNNKQNKEEGIEELIEKSDKHKYNIQIKGITYNNINIAFVFKFTNTFIKSQNKLNNEKYAPKCNKNLVMFDLLSLNYIRTLVVDKKSGLRNLRNIDDDNNKIIIEKNKLNIKKNRKKTKSSITGDDNESPEDSEKKKNTILITKEKLIELQTNNSFEIKDFIFTLPMYGKDIALEKFRPNGEKYSASKITEPLIKIHISSFCKRIEEKVHLHQNIRKRKNTNLINNNQIESLKSSNNENYSININSPTSLEGSNQNSDFHKDEINKGLIPETSSSFSNIFKSNTINNIKILIAFTFFTTFAFLLLEFIITYHQMNKLKTKINFLYNGYKILNNMLHTKFYVTESVLGNALNINYAPVIYYNMGLDTFLKDIANELNKNREEFTEIYDSFSSNELCKEYKDYMKNTKIIINTLTVNTPENITIVFSGAMTRIPAAINNLVSDPYLIKMNNRDTYELMYNLINEYYIHWEKIILILFNDSIKSTKLRLPLKIIILVYSINSIIILILLIILLSKFYFDREKPINLFLSLKKQVFENLKASAENFSNKLLNKFFGNEEIEEESQQDYQSNIQLNDINIVKFKAANQYNFSIKKAFSFILIIIIIITFLLIYLIYFIVKYFDFNKKMENIYKFILLFDKTNIAQNDCILTLDIVKSYLFNKSIPILNKTNTKKEFFDRFLNLVNKFEEAIILNSKSSSLLGGDFNQKYGQYLYENFIELFDKTFFEEHKNLIQQIESGLNTIQVRFNEIIRYAIIRYCKYYDINIDNNDDISFILKEKEFKLYEINILVQIIMRPWYTNFLKLMMNSFYDFVDGRILIYIILFICLIVIVILYYFIVWKSNEEKLNILLKDSSDLINLIPQEIKNIIIEKFNE